MNTPVATLPVVSHVGAPNKKRRVLLIDVSHAKRDVRAGVMRKLGMDVDCAADISEARSWWRADLYDLVLINVENGQGQRDRFCDDIRAATPSQRLAFLVGQPEYLSDAPTMNQEPAVEGGAKALANWGVALSDRGNLGQRWGILEASRRISAVRSASIARTRAMRAIPPPPRDSEGRPAKPVAASLDDLLRENAEKVAEARLQHAGQ